MYNTHFQWVVAGVADLGNTRLIEMHLGKNPANVEGALKSMWKAKEVCPAPYFFLYPSSQLYCR